jgi:hypothetical protein
MTGVVCKLEHISCAKHEYYLNRERENYEIKAFVENKTNYALCLKNAVNFHAA